MSDYGRETVRFFEIDQPFCALTFGVAPCTAALGVTGSNKCYQSRFTCHDPDNYDPGVLTLRFAMSQEGLLQHRDKYGPVIPSMIELGTTPGALNLAGMDRNAKALGQREAVSVTFEDHLYDDHLVDKYRLERKAGTAGSTFDPYTQGTFWGKWIARNPYFTNYACRVREGFLGQALHEMRVRHYIIDRIEGPADGRVRLTAKDLFSVIEARKAVAPLPSQGELLADISAVAGSATLTPAGIGNEEYPASGHVRVGDESIAFTRAGDVLTLTTRGALGSVAAEHKAEDLVQLVLSYTADLAVDIVYDLFVSHSEIQIPASIKAAWDVLAAELTELYTAHITEPTPVLDLIGELEEQAGFTVWPDVSTGEVKLAVLRPSASTATVDDNAWIIDGSLSIKRQDEKRVSRVMVYYGQINPNEDLNEARNFHSRYVTQDLVAEGPQQYGVPALREVKSRWIAQFGRQNAQAVSERLLAMYRDPPREAQFALHASRDGELELARPFTLRIAEIQDATGAVLDLVMVPVMLERGLERIDCTAEQVNFSGGGSSGLGGNTRELFIENDSLNLNLRTIHDSQFAAPTGVETVTFTIVSGFTVGSTSSSAALNVGSWPLGTTLILIVDGRVQGKGGAGGAGATSGAAMPGESGGPAILAEYPISIDNTNGQIWSGGGGGGGGGFAGNGSVGGGGGGGGSGTNGGGGGNGGSVTSPGSPGATGTPDTGGDAGAGGNAVPTDWFGGNGGMGGAPGVAGSAGASGSGGLPFGAGAAGGSAGNYITGNNNVTWIAVGDVRGGVA